MKQLNYERQQIHTLLPDWKFLQMVVEKNKTFMELYQIVKDEQKLAEFIDWLPNLKDNETFYLSLFARKKYCQELIKSNDKTQLKRFTANKENMMDKIRQLEIPIGRWKLREMAAPQESLVLYIMPNPRCMKKATEAMGKACWDLHRSNNFNLHQEAMSCIQRSKSYSFVVDFDIDSKNVDLHKLNDILPDGSYRILETKGGYHILVNPKIPTYNINGHNQSFWEGWYKKITSTFPVDQSKDQMIPIPGCVQSDFVPKFVK